MSKSTHDDPALICIPDITGFTRFMAENDLEFSRKIIPPLLRSLVNANRLELTVGEVEGDSVVFYRYGALPPLRDVVEQCKVFYLEFNRRLKELMEEYADDFLKHASSERLSLKVVVHAAEMLSTEIGGMVKLIGEDVVAVHKLLKNSIPDSEYILMTEKFFAHYPPEIAEDIFTWSDLKDGEDTYEYIGRIAYRYISLEKVTEDESSKSKSAS